MNWNDLLKIADEAGFTPLPIGEYHVVVDKAVAKQTGTGKDMIVTTFRVLSGPSANKTCMNNFVLTPDSPNAIGFFFRHMAAMGLAPEFFKTNPPMANVAAALVGRQCVIEVTHREWNGQMRDDVSKIKPVTGGPVPGAAAAPTPAPAPAPAPQSAPAPVPAPAPQAAPQPAPAPQYSEPQYSQPAYQDPAPEPAPEAPAPAPSTVMEPPF